MNHLFSYFPRIKNWALGHRPPAAARVARGVNRALSSSMENTAQRSGNEPSELPYELIKLITKDFSEELGRGTFGIVYKGVYADGAEIAVKVLRNISGGLDDVEFQKEFDNLRGLKHPNIVELVAFCNEIVEEPAEFQGQQITAGRVRTALCFEYVHNGGLNKFISDQYTGLGWPERYKIIRGVCEGLAYLRLEIENPIMHLDLKPENILLNKNMEAKIADFGISKLFGEENTKKTMSVIGTMGYWPPEYIKHQIISKEFDIFSLGVIIVKIMVGQNYNSIVEMTARKSIKLFYEDDGDSSTLSSDINNITTPSSETSFIPQSENGPDLELLDSEHTELLHVQPRELCFPFMSSLEVLPRKKAMISCSLQLNNKENDRVAFMLVAKTPKKYLTRKPLCGIVPPRCIYTLSLTMPKQPPVTSSSDSGGDYFTLYTTLVSQYDPRDHDKDSVSVKYHKLFEKAKQAGEEVHELTLRAICDQPAQGASSSDQIIIVPDAQQVSSIDVHPTEPWILTTNHVGIIRVWNYHTMETLDSFKLVIYEPVCAAKFIAREKWIITGDGNGVIHVYSYDQNQHDKTLDAQDSCITTLVVHPTQPFVLSLSDDEDDPLIKLWDWDRGWECTREFRGHTNKVMQVTFNPENKDCFASASCDGTVKIWSICSDKITTLKLGGQSLLCVDYFTRRNQRYLIVGCQDKTAQIWKLEMNGCFDKLEGHAGHISAVSLHPEHRLLLTGSLDGTVRVWNSITYKLENIIGFNLGAVYAFGCIKGSRMVVGCHEGIAMVKISLPSASRC
ncbi:hypothetical protein VPH35_049971 [Triticum aestivum]|uniref:non-specific serine/threonine protein kinase n=3 Tax=Triticum TaxID=4564 RepID=A0A9R1Q9S7_TRITD|nr:unnamed protein product [Triticum turgidum subsp. durum]